MRYLQPVKLSVILRGTPVAQAHQANALGTQHEIVWRNQVDATVRSSCRLLSLREGTLTIAADNPTSAGQLRYLSRILVQQLQCHAEFSGLQRLRILVRPAAPLPRNRQARPLPRLSSATAKHLREVADSLGLAELSKGLRALARHEDDEKNSKVSDVEP